MDTITGQASIAETEAYRRARPAVKAPNKRDERYCSRDESSRKAGLMAGGVIYWLGRSAAKEISFTC